MRIVVAALMAALFLLAALVSGAQPASAHESLSSSSPAAGATLEQLPAKVTLTFSGAMSAPAYVIVTAPDGTAMADGDAVVEGSTVTQQVTADGPAGTYQVAYRAVSADGHQLTGQFAFEVTVGAEAEVASEAPSASPSSTPSVPTSAAPEAEPTVVGADSNDGSGIGWQWWVGGALVLGAIGLGIASRRT